MLARRTSVAASTQLRRGQKDFRPNTCTNNQQKWKKNLFVQRQHQHQHQQQKRYYFATGPKCNKNTKKKDLPPPLPSPRKAHEEYLKSRAKTDEFLQDPQSKINQMTQELEAVRNRATSKLDAEINKPIWRKLTDPLRRYKHSMINIGAMSLAYMLAYTLFVKSKSEKTAKQQLSEQQDTNEELKAVLRNLLHKETIQQISQACIEEMDKGSEEDQLSSSSSSGWWFGNGSSSSSSSSRNQRRERRRKQREQQQKPAATTASSEKEKKNSHQLALLQTELEKQLKARIGDNALTAEEMQEKSMKEVWAESTKQVKALQDNSAVIEQLIMDAIMEEDKEKEEGDISTNNISSDDGSNNDTNRKRQPRRVFSM